MEEVLKYDLARKLSWVELVKAAWDRRLRMKIHAREEMRRQRDALQDWLSTEDQSTCTTSSNEELLTSSLCADLPKTSMDHI